MVPRAPPPLPPKHTLDFLAALIIGLCPKSSALPPVFSPATYAPCGLEPPQGACTAAAIDCGPVGRARNPSKLTVWCIYSGSGLSCQRAKCARLAQSHTTWAKGPFRARPGQAAPPRLKQHGADVSVTRTAAGGEEAAARATAS